MRLKIQLQTSPSGAPGAAVKVEISIDSLVKDLLACIASKLRDNGFDDNFCFDVTFGHPPQSLVSYRKSKTESESPEDLLTRGVNSVGIRNGDMLRVTSA